MGANTEGVWVIVQLLRGVAVALRGGANGAATKRWASNGICGTLVLCKLSSWL